MGIFDLFGRSNSKKDENHVFKNILEYLSEVNIELFEFVKTIVENSKKGEKIDHEELEKLTQILVMKLRWKIVAFLKVLGKMILPPKN